MRYRYYNELSFPGLLDGHTGEDGYLILRPWSGGWNNIRMSYEIAAGLAFLLNRTLVLPQSYKIYLLETVSNADTFFDMDSFGIKTMRFEEFAQQEGIEATYEAVENISVIYPFDVSCNRIFNLTDRDVPADFLKRNVIFNSDLLNARYVFFDRCLLGAFDQAIYTDRVQDLRRFIAKHIRYRDEIFQIAEHAAKAIGPYFYTMHVRRGDFQCFAQIPEAERLSNLIESFTTRDIPYYIATDEKDRSFFEPLARGRELVFYKDLGLPDYNPDWLPLVEQLICAQGVKFIGTAMSTLSSYVYRLRGYMQCHDTNFYTTVEGWDPKAQCSYEEEQHLTMTGTWTREFKETFLGL